MFLVRSVSPCCCRLLAQKGMALLDRIYKHDRQQCSHSCNEKHFHAHRIARSPKIVPYSEFANTKQL